MTALSADALRDSRNLGARRKYKVAGSVTIYKGALVMMDAGYATPAAVGSATQDGCVGVALAAVDNSAGAAGAAYVTVQEGEFLFTGQTLAQATSEGHLLFADDDNTVDETDAGSAPVAGYCTEFVSSTQAWVLVSPLALRA